MQKQNVSKKLNKLISVCIIGKPNAGKSTLLNYIIGEKLSIVTPKVQTTRSIITGIVTIDNTQLIILDTPGIFEPKKKLEKAMVRYAWSSLNSVDVIIIIIDTSQALDKKMNEIIKRTSSTGKKIIFLLNKIDLNSKHYIDHLSFVQNTTPAARIFNISALNGKGIEEFISYLQENATASDWLYEKDDITNLPARFLASEITREQLFLQTHQELPYNLVVECECWEEQNNGSIKINQVIIVNRASHKNMIIGNNGKKIREIGQAARINIEKLLGKKIHLFLFVKASPNFMNNWNF